MRGVTAYVDMTPEERARRRAARAPHRLVADAYRLQHPGLPAAEVTDLGAGPAAFVLVGPDDEPDDAYAYAASPEQTDVVAGDRRWSVGFHDDSTGNGTVLYLPADTEPGVVAQALAGAVLLLQTRASVR